MAINEEDRSGSLDLALSVSGYFGLSTKEARGIAAEVGRAVRKWKEKALALKISKSEVERISSAFTHDNLEQALANPGSAKRPARPRRQKEATT